MNFDWASIDDFKKSGFKGGWQFKHLRSFVRDGTLEENVPRNSGVYMVLRNSSSTPEFIEYETGAEFAKEKSECSNQQVEERIGS